MSSTRRRCGRKRGGRGARTRSAKKVERIQRPADFLRIADRREVVTHAAKGQNALLPVVKHEQLAVEDAALQAFRPGHVHTASLRHFAEQLPQFECARREIGGRKATARTGTMDARACHTGR